MDSVVDSKNDAGFEKASSVESDLVKQISDEDLNEDSGIKEELNSEASDDFDESELSTCARAFFLCFSSRGRVSKILKQRRRQERRQHERKRFSWKRSVRRGFSNSFSEPLSLKEFLKRKFNFYTQSFLQDYIGLLCLISVAVVIYGSDFFRATPFLLNDTSIQRPLHEDQSWVWGVLGFAFFVAIVTAFRNDTEILHALALVFVASLTMTFVIGLVIANFWGVASPDFLSRCAVDCLKNVTWIITENGIAQCNAPDPRHGGVMFECPKSEFTFQEVCGPIAVAVPLSFKRVCQAGVGTFGEAYSISKGFRSAFSISTGSLTAVMTIFSFLAWNWSKSAVLSIAAISLSVLMVGLVSAYQIANARHFTFDVVLSVVVGWLITRSLIPLYFHTGRKGGTPRRRPKRFLTRRREEISDSETSESEDEDNPFALESFLFDETASHTTGSRSSLGVLAQAPSSPLSMSRHVKFRPRAIWDAHYKRKVAKDKLSFSFIAKRLIKSELHLLEEVLPTFVLTFALVVVLYFSLYVPFVRGSANYVIWLSFSLELLLYPVLENFVVSSMIWNSSFFLSSWVSLFGVFFSTVCWVPISLFFRSEIESDDGRLWILLFLMWLVSKLFYFAGMVICVFVMYRHLEWFQNEREFLLRQRAGFRASKFAVVFPLLVCTSMMMLMLMVFYVYQYIEVEDVVVQFVVLGAAALADAATRVWLTALMTKGFVAALADVDEIQAYIFSIRYVKLGFALMQGFAIGRIIGTGAFILACLGTSAFEILVIVFSILRRHHPRAPHIRVRIANFFGLPGWKMFPQKTRLETALLIRSQEMAEIVCMVFGPMFGQLPLHLDLFPKNVFDAQVLPWYAVVVRSLILLCFECVTDCFKSWLATRVLGIDTVHVRPRDVDLFATLYLSIAIVLGFVAVTGGHALFFLWEADEFNDR